jgi:outer membrane biosynthesis protein TonB
MPFINIVPSDPANDVEVTQTRTAPRMSIVTAPPPANDNQKDRRDDEDGPGWGLLAALCVVSIGIHVALVGGLGHGGKGTGSRPHRRPAEVTMTVAPPKPAPPAPPAAKAPEPAKAVKRLAVKAAPRAVEPAAAPPPQAETPADFSGTTLTNDGPGPGWSSAVGNGQAMRGPIGTPGARVTGRSVAGDATGTGKAGPPIVALGSLSRPPVPPDLNGALERHYPTEARRQGTPGQAVLKARVLPDGHVRDLVVVSQSGPGFGDACRATLRDSVWSAPLDKTGAPVATFVTYTCRFEVR